MNCQVQNNTMKTLLIVFASFLSSVTAFQTVDSRRSSLKLRETRDDLKELAASTNPFPGFWDPLGFSEMSLWGFDEEQTVGWLRHSEIKHGRIAQMAFVGYCVQSLWRWPWAMTLDGTPFPSVSLSPPEQWDALPIASKLQIILFIGFLEVYSEFTPQEGNESVGGLRHYARGGVPGKYPNFTDIPHPVPFNLYDPFGLSKNMNEKTKKRRLSAELNNGRLAMLGIFGFLCEQKIPGSVPLLSGVVPPYSGEVMAPFEANIVF